MSPAEQESRFEMRGKSSLPTRIRLLEYDADNVERQQLEDAEWRKMITRMVFAFLSASLVAAVGAIVTLLTVISQTRVHP